MVADRPGAERRKRDERGFSSVLIACMVPAFVMIAGLVFDGGNAMATKRRAVDEAQSAARAGAMAEAAALRYSNGTVLDAPAAVAAAQQLLAAAGLTGDVQVNGDAVTVTVHVHYQSTLLPTSFDVVGTGTARPLCGIRQVEC